jgi:hypothetical protein
VGQALKLQPNFAEAAQLQKRLDKQSPPADAPHERPPPDESSSSIN